MVNYIFVHPTSTNSWGDRNRTRNPSWLRTTALRLSHCHSWYSIKLAYICSLIDHTRTLMIITLIWKTDFEISTSSLSLKIYNCYLQCTRLGSNQEPFTLENSWFTPAPPSPTCCVILVYQFLLIDAEQAKIAIVAVLEKGLSRLRLGYTSPFFERVLFIVLRRP